MEVMELKTPDGDRFYCLPDNACCEADPEKRSPEVMLQCPLCAFDPFGMTCIPEECDHYKEE